MKPKTIALLILAGLFIVVLLQNTQVVSVQFLFWEISMSRIILLPVVMGMGFIIGFFMGKRKG
ncbi:MAG: LapA family protein [Candidatus Omnitrophica bacterium]|nr:LapA family protein [Candidatus Omnitrophota bacterium]